MANEESTGLNIMIKDSLLIGELNICIANFMKSRDFFYG